MNFLRFLRAVLIVYIIYEIFGYFIHTQVLCDCYTEISDLWRKDARNYMKYMYVSDFIFTTIFVSIYAVFVKRHTITFGIFFGFLFSLLLITTMVNQYVAYPLTKHLLVLWIIFAIIQMLLCGLAVGIIYRPKKAKRIAQPEIITKEEIESENNKEVNEIINEDKMEIKKDSTSDSEIP